MFDVYFEMFDDVDVHLNVNLCRVLRLNLSLSFAAILPAGPKPEASKCSMQCLS